jgi:hypothetical protein
MQPQAAGVKRASVVAPDDPSNAAARWVYAAALVLAFAGVFTCMCDTPMIWDGAYQFCFSLIQQKPYFYLTRFHSFILWGPMVALTHVTGNLTVLKMAYGLPFTLAPAFSVLVSWWVVRKRAPWLIVWAIFGAAAGPLPGQIFIINDSIFQQHMFWPVFLGLLVHLEWPQIIVLTLLAAFQFSHQIGLILLGGGAGAAALLAIRDRANRVELLTKAGLFAVLAIAALWKIMLNPDSYAQREFTWERAHEAWRWGVEGYALRGLEFMWAAGICVLLHGALHGSRLVTERRLMRFGAAFCVGAALVTWTIWAHKSTLWSTAVNYRRWVVPLTVPFYLMAFADQWIRLRHLSTAHNWVRVRLPVGFAVAGVFALVLSIQSIVWVRLTHRLMHEVETYPAAVVPWDDVGQWAKDTPLYHWGTASYVFVLEGRQPRKLVLDPDPGDVEKQLDMIYGNPPAVPLSWFTPVSPDPGPAGWFDFRPMLRQIRPGAKRVTGEGV